MSQIVNPLSPVPPELLKVQGIEKLRRLIEREIRSPNVNEKSSNLPHLLSILKCLRNLEEKRLPSAVLKPFPFSQAASGRMLVDIVSADGDSWFKVSARNPKALNMLAAGEGNFGQKSILDHVLEYQECAKENPCLFKTPKVTVIFTSGISESLALEMESMGVSVVGERILDEELEERPRIKVFENSGNLKEFRDKVLALDELEEEDDAVLGFKNPSLEGVTKLNLDITAFLAFISNLTNGHADVEFEKEILINQAKAERERPQKWALDSIFKGRQLFCCETAMKEFQSILSTVGGAEEKVRAEEFLKQITVIPDDVSERVKSLYISGNIKERSRVIFGTGDSIQAVTVTANTGFVRSAKTQGVDIAVFIHESRALTEQKENIVKMRKAS